MTTEALAERGSLLLNVDSPVQPTWRAMAADPKDGDGTDGTDGDGADGEEGDGDGTDGKDGDGTDGTDGDGTDGAAH
jgi:hypothetical protein